MIYREHLLGGGDINLKRSNFTGDELDLGWLENFIYKHDTNRTVISYTYEFAGSKGDYAIIRRRRQEYNGSIRYLPHCP